METRLPWIASDWTRLSTNTQADDRERFNDPQWQRQAQKFPGWAASVAPSGTRAYLTLAGANSGIEMVDISRPDAPRRLDGYQDVPDWSRLDYPVSPNYRIVVTDGFAWVAAGRDGLRVFAVEGPELGINRD